MSLHAGVSQGANVHDRFFQDPVPFNIKPDFMAKLILKLFVTGSNPRSERAIVNLRRICEEELEGEYELTIIDVLERPQLAEDEKILATPTLIKELPPPIRRIIGDLSQKESVLIGLDLYSRKANGNEA